MARPREFDRETALQKAIKVFSDHGFEGTSTGALLAAMRISRQSLYDTFGDKRRLYLEALQRYNADSISDLTGTMNASSSALEGLEAALVAFAARPRADAGIGCLGVSAICEFGTSDRDVTLLSETSGRILRSALENLIAKARKNGEIDAGVDTTDAAEFIAATFSGMKVAARGGASPESLRGIARMAIRSLK